MLTPIAYVGAAIAEIAGCFSFWAWLRLDKSPWWVLPGMISLALFAWLLTLIDSDAAGRAFAAYGVSTSSHPWDGCGPWKDCVLIAGMRSARLFALSGQRSSSLGLALPFPFDRPHFV